MENKKMNIDEMDKVSGGNAGNIGQGDLDILTPKDIDITKPNNDERFQAQSWVERTLLLSVTLLKV